MTDERTGLLASSDPEVEGDEVAPLTASQSLLQVQARSQRRKQTWLSSTMSRLRGRIAAVTMSLLLLVLFGGLLAS